MSKIHVLMLIAMLTIVNILSYADDNKTVFNTSIVFTEYSEKCNKIISFLEKPDSWKDAYFIKDELKTNVLLEHLKLVKILKPNEMENLLIEKINYLPYAGMPLGLMKREELFPVYGTLCEMNLSVVIPLIKFIKQGGHEKQKLSDILVVECLVKVYERGGFGKEMAKKRLELELEKATEPEKANIKKALELIDSK